MKVLFVYKYLTLGGVEAVLRARLEGMPRLGVDARAWLLQEGEGRAMFDGLEERLHVGGIGALRAFLASELQDVVCTIDTPEVVPALDPSSGVRLVVEAHSPYLENLEYLRTLAIDRVAAFWAPSEYQRGVVLERIGKGAEVRVVPNALSESFVRELRPFVPRPPRPIMAWVGRLDHLKNWRGFLAIAGTIGREIAEVEFWMAGDSPEEDAAQALFQRAQREGIAERLYWHRSLPHDRVATWLDAVRESGGMVISTSRGESFGMAVAEAMARGCPVAAPAAGPFPELIQDDITGLLYRPGSVAGGAAAARRYLQETDLRTECGRMARETILSRHRPEAALEVVHKALRGASRG